VLSQDYANIEIVIVGDRCIDDTADKVRSILDKRVKFYDLPRRGKYPSHIENRWFVQGSVPRNAGMKIATGKWFVFLSDDDILYPNHVSTLIKAAKSQNLEFVSAAYETVKDGERITVGPRKLNVGSELVCGGMQTWLYRSYLRCFRWNRHSWRKAFDRPVDYDLQQRLFEAGVRMGNISDVVYFNPPVEGTNTTGYAAALEVASKRS
jgi:glycosyltransferase involved in cell wall biosynthesis